MKKSIFQKIINRLRKNFLKGGLISYAQAGEDLILNIIFLSKNNGTYIDVGANHPIKFSNTYFFYKKGWTGINIDASPSAIKLFRKKRKKDINLEIGVNNKEDNLNFYMFKESCYNTFNEDIVNDIKKVTELKEVIKIPVKPLSSILKQYKLPVIDFMSIDVEGLDLEVLKSNDWNQFRPKIIIVEESNLGLDILKSSIYEYMLSMGYFYFCQSSINTFYIEKDFYLKRFK